MIRIFNVIFLLLFSSFLYATSCDKKVCDGYTLPSEAIQIINDGYEQVAVKNIFGKKYLSLTSNNDVNQCSILFLISDKSINTNPVVNKNNLICNMSLEGGKVVSSWRDAGKWNEDVYQISDDGIWMLVFRDTCTGCDIVKRVFFKNNEIVNSELMRDGKNFLDRKSITGQISIDKSFLLSSPDLTDRKKAYLIKGDKVKLLDMTDNEDFYKISYETKSGKVIVAWIVSDDCSLDKE